MLVGVDGVGGSGKTMFADELAAQFRTNGRATIRISVDDFHNVRAIRYRRGRESSEGCWLDSSNYPPLFSECCAPSAPQARGCAARLHMTSPPIASSAQNRGCPRRAQSS